MKRLLLVLIAFVGLAASIHVFAQADPNAGSGGDAAQDQNSGQLAHQSREASGEDDTAQFKRSGSVQLVSRITGLDLEHAYWVCIVLNFAIVAGMIFWLSKKNLPAMFKNRSVTIQKSIEEARQASADANRRLKDVETRLSKLDAEIAAMSAAGEKEAVAEEQRIKAAAEEDARRIVESAEHEIDAAIKTARRDLKNFAADLAVTLARKQIKVDDATDHNLIEGFARQLSGNAPSSSGGRDRN